MKEKTLTLHKKDLGKFALSFLTDSIPLAGERAVFVALIGDLGAGKTAFVKEVAKLLDVGEEIISPTFILKKEYETGVSEIEKLVHVDAYRLSSKKEGHVLKLSEDNNPKTLIFIEWPDNIDPLPYSASIEFTYKDEETREVSYKIHEK